MSKDGSSDYYKETLDVVDENDQVIGTMSKKDVHTGVKIIHREIAVLIYDTNGNLLLQQRSYKKKSYPGAWSIATTGHVLAGQTPEEAAHMELKEELGFDTELKFVEKRIYEYENHKSFGYLYLGKFPKGAMIVPDRDEVQKAKFISQVDILKMQEEGSIDPHSIKTINNYLNGVYTE